MKELILKLMEAKDYKNKTFDELAVIYKDKAQLKEALDELIDEGKVFLSIKNTYCLARSYNYYLGKVVRVKEFFAFVNLIEDNIDVYVDRKDLNNALVNDMVLIHVTPNTTKGEVINILKRGNNQFVGEIQQKGSYYYVLPDDLEINQPIIVSSDKKNPPLEDGLKVVVAINNYFSDYIEVNIVEVLGLKNAPGVDILSIVKEHQVPYEFSSEAIKQAESLPSEVSEVEINNRVDYRNELIVTIDGDDSKDFDDAVSLTRNEDGNYTLAVHIADVSYYVKEKTFIDVEALSRGNSIYLADRVIPMLPVKLSNGICSLNPNLDRLVLSCIMTIAPYGEVLDYKITEGVIRSKYRLTYNRVNRLFNDNERYDDEELNKMLLLMKGLALVVRKRKEEKGTLNLDIDEARIIVDKDGKAIDVKVRERGISEGIIEQFMILANETVASHIYWQHLPCIYRVHGVPELKKIRAFAQLIRPLGYVLKGEANGIHVKQLQEILKQAQEEENGNVVTTFLLRSLPKAKYSANNDGHFGLASDCYSHFTSPIRRYSDLLLHRLVKLYASNESYDYQSLVNKVVYIAEATSISERKAIEIEREVNDMKMAEYMEDHIGETYEGLISGFNQVGLYVELANTIEGFVRFNSIELGEEFFYDEKRMVAVSNKGRMIVLGQKIKVKVLKASKKLRQIDFEITKIYSKDGKKQAKKEDKGHTRRPRKEDKGYKRERNGSRKRKGDNKKGKYK